jgi:hypothetical protein
MNNNYIIQNNLIQNYLQMNNQIILNTLSQIHHYTNLNNNNLINQLMNLHQMNSSNK